MSAEPPRPQGLSKGAICIRWLAAGLLLFPSMLVAGEVAAVGFVTLGAAGIVLGLTRDGKTRLIPDVFACFMLGAMLGGLAATGVVVWTGFRNWTNGPG